MRRFRGDTYPSKHKVVNWVGKPVDLTGWSGFVMTISATENPAPGSPNLGQYPGTVVAPATGEIQFDWSGTTLLAGSYFFDVQCVDADSKIRTLIKSTVEIVQDITP